MGLLVLQELDFFLTLLRLDFLSLNVALINSVDLSLQINHLVVSLQLSGLKLNDSLFQISTTMLSLQLLAHRESY